ncbi:unnamed protein product [Paramecium pentaurelia]|uniref:PH domain-containing protein n=1 Tax=Paramecium pentaurelia TaxID=43138 RepID=A0A8S1VN71_9CILI|nr:unnamed protein product [Paramecium pentaurelia]
MNDNLSKALQLNGVLQKRSPSMIKGYQKRYFSVRNEGQYLIYWKKKPLSSKDKPQGVLSLTSISTVANVKGSDTEFILVVGDRQFQLKAETASQREFWVESILHLKEYRQKLEGDNEPVQQKVKWDELDKETITKIKLEVEKDHLEKFSNKIDIKNDEVMKCKGIYPYLIKFDAKTQDQFIICGFLMKKGKNTTFTRAKKRWFIMMSSVCITGQETDKVGPTQADIPDTFQLDTIYYFAYDDRGDKSNFIARIPVSEIENIEQIDKTSGQLPYGLSFEYNDRVYQFFSEQLTDIQKWILAIQCVKKKPKTGLKNSQQLEKKEEIIFEGPLQKQSSKIIKGPLSWINVNAQLKKNSLSWTAKDDSQGNQYVLLIYIKQVIGKSKSFQIFTNDDQEFKFKAQTPELKDQWVKIIKEQVDALKGSIQNLEEILELPPEEATKIDYNEQIKDEDLYDQETITEKFYNKMTLQIEKSKQEEKLKSKSFMSKLLCCFGGGESEYDYVKDRGF